MVYNNYHFVLFNYDSYQKIESKHKPNKMIVCIVLIFAFAIPKLFSFLKLPYISTNYFVIYFLGYYIAKFKIKNNTKNFVFLGVFLFLFAIIARLVGKYYLDRDYQDLYQLLVSITHPLTAISFYFIFDYLTAKIKLLKLLARSKFWNTLDKYSYCVYITHYAFLNSVTSVTNFGFSKSISVILFFLFTAISSIVLFNLNKIIQKKIS